jgi:hypothetical protein
LKVVFASNREAPGSITGSANRTLDWPKYRARFSPDGQNQEYFEELFHFYVDSPEWFQGGLKRAATLVDSAGAGREELLQQLAESRKEHSGPAWWIRRAVLWISATVGQIVP